MSLRLSLALPTCHPFSTNIYDTPVWPIGSTAVYSVCCLLDLSWLARLGSLGSLGSMKWRCAPSNFSGDPFCNSDANFLFDKGHWCRKQLECATRRTLPRHSYHLTVSLRNCRWRSRKGGYVVAFSLALSTCRPFSTNVLRLACLAYRENCSLQHVLSA